MGHQVIYGCYNKLGVTTDSACAENLNSLAVGEVLTLQFRNFLISGSSKAEHNFFENDNFILAFVGRITLGEFSFSGCQNAEHLIDTIFTDPNSLRGGFAIICFNKLSGELLLLRDHLGIIPLYYFEDSDCYYFSTDIKYLLPIIGSNIIVDEQWIADSISTVKSEKWRTFYKGILKVLPGHVHKVFGSQCTQDQYWKLESIDEREDLGYSEAVNVYRELLIQAVQRGLVSTTKLGLELSGGLDSSGVLAIAHQLVQDKGQTLSVLTHAFSEVSLGKYFPHNDETYYSKALCKAFKISDHILCDADHHGIIQAMKSNIVNQSGPTQQGYSLFSDVIYNKADDIGFGILLSGFGGDEGVSSSAKAYLLELESKKNWPKYREVLFNSSEYKKSYSYKFLKYIVIRFFPFLKYFIERLYNRNSQILRGFSYLAVDQNFDSRIHVRERYKEEYSKDSYRLLRDVQLSKITHNHISQRFEYSYHNAGSHGIEYAYPLWDVDLLEFYFSLPAEYKHRNGFGRAIYREAMKGILPEKIRLRTDKSGATIPTIHQRFLMDYKEIIDIIKEAKALNNFHYLDYDKMLDWSERLKNWGKGKDPVLPGPYFNSLQILLLQQMERSGEFKSGIKY